VHAAPARADDLERRAKAVEKQIVAPCCFKGTLDDHPSPLADQLRKEIREWLKQGQSQATILGEIKRRYGQRALAEPPKGKFSGFVLYGLPFGLAALLLLGLTFLATRGREEPAAPSALPESAVLPEAMEKRLDALIDAEPAGRS
jgi:cytochrome c-type biogenesis protein CcmH